MNAVAPICPCNELASPAGTDQKNKKRNANGLLPSVVSVVNPMTKETPTTKNNQKFGVSCFEMIYAHRHHGGPVSPDFLLTVIFSFSIHLVFFFFSLKYLLYIAPAFDIYEKRIGAR